MGRGAAAALLLLSGAIALVYEIVWTRQMALLIGASTPAVSIVLAVFMAGLATGARVLGGMSDRSAAPLRLYAILEAGVGAYALALPQILRLATPLYVRAAQALQGEPLALGAARLAAGVALLGLPTVLMGGTLPAMLKAVARRPDGLGMDLGALYSANLLGGAAGSLAAAFVLVRALGIHGTVALAALGNLLIALGALFWPARPTTAVAAAEDPGASAAGRAPREGLPPEGVLLTVVFLSGFLTMAYEVLWTRILVFTFLSTVHAFAVILAVFLLGLVLGSVSFTLAERRGRAGVGLLCGVQMAGALFALGLAPVGAHVGGVIDAFSSRFGFTGPVYVLAMAASSGLLMLVPATLMGVVFPLTCRLVMAEVGDSGAALGRAYWVNTMGAVAGALTTGFGLVPLLGLKGSLALLAGVQVLAGWMPMLWVPGWRERRLSVGLASAAGLAAAFGLVSVTLTGPAPFEETPAALVLAHRDDATASVTVASSPHGGRRLLIDGFEAASADGRSGYMAMMGHIPMLLHPKPERALVVCFGTGTTAGSILRYPDVRLDIVDINRTVLDFAPHFLDFNHGVAGDPRTRVTIEDGRGFLLTSPGGYDVITSEPMPPTFAGVASLYSREYYELARSRLRPGGLVTQWLPFHIVTPAQAWSILRSVHEVFPETTLWVHQGTGIIVARRDAVVTLDAEDLSRRYAPVAGELARFGVPGPGAFIDMYALDAAGVAALTRMATTVTDDRPSLEYDPPRHRAARTLGGRVEEELRALRAVYSLRTPDVPMLGASAADLETLRVRRGAGSHAALGDLYLTAGLGREARAEYERGLAASTEPWQRAMFLFALAQVARTDGRTAEALELVGKSLALGPDNAAALKLRESLVAP